jgi:hypothetical protein
LTAEKITALLCEAPVRDRTLEVELVSPILTGIALILVIIRLITKRNNQFGWDDGLIIVALVATIGLALTHIMNGVYGLGKDLWTVSFDDVTTFLHWFYPGEIFYISSTTLTKLSILAFYLRVFSASPRFALMVKVVFALALATGVIFDFILIFQCWPISFSWTRWDGEGHGHCVNVNLGSWVHAAMNIVFDLIVLVLPLPMLWQLQLDYSWRKKARIFLMFSVGLIVTIVSVIRLRALIKFANTQNVTWDYTETAVWSGVEAAVGVICACLPSLKVFLTRTAPGVFGSERRDRSGYGQASSISVQRDWTVSSGPLQKNPFHPDNGQPGEAYAMDGWHGRNYKQRNADVSTWERRERSDSRIGFAK